MKNDPKVNESPTQSEEKPDLYADRNALVDEENRTREEAFQEEMLRTNK